MKVHSDPGNEVMTSNLLTVTTKHPVSVSRYVCHSMNDTLDTLTCRHIHYNQIRIVGICLMAMTHTDILATDWRNLPQPKAKQSKSMFLVVEQLYNHSRLSVCVSLCHTF